MQIIKYTKKGNGNYDILLDNNKKITLSEDLILKNNLLYKKEVDPYLLEGLLTENIKYDIYNKCVKYISIRLRSINEIKEYMKRLNADEETINNTIDRLLKNNLLNDEVFTKAFIQDKLNFTTMGPYRIEQELKRQHIDNTIISKYLYNIDKDILITKINKQINKLIKSNKKKDNLKNKIYKNLLSLGYSNDMILKELNKYF